MAIVDDCTIVAKPHPLRSETVCAKARAGQTLLQMLGDGASHALDVRVGGELVPRELWARVKPKTGQFIHVQVYPQGGNGGKWLRTILLVVVAIVAIYVSGGSAAPWVYSAFGGNAALAGAVIGMVGSLAVTPLVGTAREILA